MKIVPPFLRKLNGLFLTAVTHLLIKINQSYLSKVTHWRRTILSICEGAQGACPLVSYLVLEHRYQAVRRKEEFSQDQAGRRVCFLRIRQTQLPDPEKGKTVS